MRAFFQTLQTELETRLDWLIWLIVVAAFYLRWQQAQLMYLNGDETQIMLPPLQRGLWNVYQAGTVFPYGPLGNFVLHILTFFGSAEWYVRMPSMIAGSLLCFVAYRWVAETFTKAAGVVTAVVLAFSPNLIHLSAEVRHYMIHALFVACAMFALDRAFREQSLRWMRWFGVALLLALLTMYMSVWFTAAVGIYALIRILREGPPRRLVLEWAGFQVAALAICGFAYSTHLYKLRDSVGEQFAREVWLRDSYYHPDTEGVVEFFLKATVNLFAYVFATRTLGYLAIVLFGAGVLLVLWKRSGKPRDVLALLLPLATTAAAAMVSLYPYGGSRHDAFLAIFLAAGIGVAVSFLLRRQLALVLAASISFAAIWPADHHYLDDIPAYHRRDQMKDFLSFFRNINPEPGVVLVEEKSGYIARYYVCKGQLEDVRQLTTDIHSFRCNGIRFLEKREWQIPEERLVAALLKARELQPGVFEQPVWVFHFAVDPPAFHALPDADGGRFGAMRLRRLYLNL